MRLYPHIVDTYRNTGTTKRVQ